MEKETKKLILTIGIFAVIIGGGYCVLIAYTGSTVPFSSVVSESMQHDNDRSSIGVIDTGDIVVVRDPSKTEIQSYVEGLSTGHNSFENYGSVIIYNRDGHNPVIHRAIIWLDYENGKWSSSELKNIEGQWHCEYLGTDGKLIRGTDPNDLKGTLYFHDIYGKAPYVNLDGLEKKSGYLTMGDNAVTNPNFDQSSGIIDHCISLENIRSVTVFEIPWIGTVKLMMNGNENLSHVPNSLPSLIMALITIFSILFFVDLIYMNRFNRQIQDRIGLSKGIGRR